MCGIAGFAGGAQNRAPEDLRLIAEKMARTMIHRGPDDEGTWVESESQLALGFRRLAILDPSDHGHQPMDSHCGRYVLVFNGEIYNFRELRAELEAIGERFRGTSDTEVLLAGIVRWGLLRTLEKSNGMFAFALWDTDERVLSLARDRLGEKPLYYGRLADSSFVFASELKAIRAHPSFRSEIDRDVLGLYFRYSCVPSPYSIYKGLAKLPPGTYLSLHPDDTASPVTPIPYWSLDHAIEAGLASPLNVSLPEAADLLDDLLADSVKLRMVADVPLGAFLSGGIDSSTVVAMMQRQASASARTFTIGFDDHDYDEAVYARAIARHLGTDHTELYVSPEQALSVIPRLPSIYDEPFADSSQIPTFLVSQLARREMTVALTGDGGDELFGGYDRYAVYRSLRRTDAIPAALRRAVATPLTKLSPRQWDSVLAKISPLLPASTRRQRPGDGIHRLAGLLRNDETRTLYRNLMSHWDDPSVLVLGTREPPTALTTSVSRFRRDPFSEAMVLDTLSYLPDDILTKVDRASMAASLETRLPLLDHRVVELAWRFNRALKFDRRSGKRVLRSVLERYVPPTLIDRPKMGFGVPIGTWLRGPLRSWAADLVNDRRIFDEGFLAAGVVREMWSQHQSGEQDWKYRLWDVVMFEAWLESTSQPGAV